MVAVFHRSSLWSSRYSDWAQCFSSRDAENLELYNPQALQIRPFSELSLQGGLTMAAPADKLLLPLKVTESGRPELQQNEVECNILKGVDIEFEGSDHHVLDARTLKGGIVHLTTHRLLWIDECSLSVHGSSGRRAFGLPFVAVADMQPPRKAVTRLFASPRLRLSVWTLPDGSISANGPSCNATSQDAVILVFRGPASYDTFVSRLQEILQTKLWLEDVPAQRGSAVAGPSGGPSAGDPPCEFNVSSTAGTLRGEEENALRMDKGLQVAFSHLSALMGKAREMVQLAEKVRARLNTAEGEEGMGSQKDMQNLIQSVDIISPVTKESAGAVYDQQLSLQMNVLSTIVMLRAMAARSFVFQKTVSRQTACAAVLRDLVRQRGDGLPKKLIKDIRNHFHCLPPSYAQALYDANQVMKHMQLIADASQLHSIGSGSGHCPTLAVHIQVHEPRASVVAPLARSLSTASISSLDPPPTSIHSPTHLNGSMGFGFGFDEIGGSLHGIPALGTPALHAAKKCPIWDLEVLDIDLEGLKGGGQEEVAGRPAVYEALFASRRHTCRPTMLSMLQRAGVHVSRLQTYEVAGGGTLGVLQLDVSPDECDAAEVDDLVRLAVQRASRPRQRPPVVTFAEDERGVGARRGGSVSNNRSRVFDSESVSMGAGSMQESPSGMLRVLVDDGLGIISGEEELRRWMLDAEKLRIGPRIAMGSSGEVCRGRYAGEDVAVKILRGSGVPGKTAAEFRREVLALSILEHENVVPFLGVCIDKKKRMCIITKYMAGGAVSDMIQRRCKRGGGLPIPEVLRIATDTAAGMQFLHEHGIIHRDLKTANILLDSKRVAKLADFGVSRLSGEKGEMTAEVGTYRWMAPETLGACTGGVGVTHKSDVYSYGIVLWELVTGSIPYRDYTPMQAAVGVALHGLRPTIPLTCPQRLSYLMQRCWADSAADRPEFSEILAELKAMSPELLGKKQEK